MIDDSEAEQSVRTCQMKSTRMLETHRVARGTWVVDTGTFTMTTTMVVSTSVPFSARSLSPCGRKHDSLGMTNVDWIFQVSTILSELIINSNPENPKQTITGCTCSSTQTSFTISQRRKSESPTTNHEAIHCFSFSLPCTCVSCGSSTVPPRQPRDSVGSSNQIC